MCCCVCSSCFSVLRCIHRLLAYFCVSYRCLICFLNFSFVLLILVNRLQRPPKVALAEVASVQKHFSDTSLRVSLPPVCGPLDSALSPRLAGARVFEAEPSRSSDKKRLKSSIRRPDRRAPLIYAELAQHARASPALLGRLGPHLAHPLPANSFELSPIAVGGSPQVFFLVFFLSSVILFKLCLASLSAD